MTAAPDTTVVVDVGGTKMGAATAAGAVAHQVLQIPTPPDGSVVPSALAELVREVQPAVERVVIATPGVIDPLTGGVADAANLGHGALPSSAELAAAVGVPVEVVGDVEAGAVAEFGAGEVDDPDGVYLTVSTGIGAGLVLDGVLRERDGTGEFGHVPVASAIARGLVCGCGGVGCLETIASGRGVATLATLEAADSPAIAARLREHGGLSARELAALADGGDRVAQRILDDGIDALAGAVVGLIRTLAPATIVVGGGFAVGAGISARLEDTMRPYWEGSRLSMPTRIRPATFRRRSVLVGAALLADPARGGAPISPRELAASEWGRRILAEHHG